MLNSLHLRKNYDAKFAAVPARLYANRNLTATDRDVCGVMLVCSGGRRDWFEVRQAEVAEFLGISERQVKRSISRLVKERELTIRRERHGGNFYQIARPAVGLAVAVRSEAREDDRKSCPQCLRRVKTLGRAGVCRQCAADADLVGRVAAARQELGPDATAEQLAAFLKNQRLANRIRRLLRAA